MRNKFKSLARQLTSPHAINVLFGIVWVSIFLLCHYSEFSSFITHRLVKPVEFSARLIAGRDVPISPRLQVYGLDDKTAAKLGRPYLVKEEWSALLHALRQKKPAAVLIDSMFTADLFATDDIDFHFDSKETRVVSGAFLSDNKVEYRKPIPADKIFRNGFIDVPSADQPDWIFHRTNSHIYGPSSSNLDFIDLVGHIQIFRPTSVPLLLKNRDNLIIPHVALHASKAIEPTADGIRIDTGIVPVDDDGHTEVNYLTPDAAVKKMRSLRGVLAQAQSGQPLKTVNEGDTVLILFNYATGNTDVVDSPYGRLPGGYILMSLINSTLTGRWIRVLSFDVLFALLAVICGILLGHTISAGKFWYAVISLTTTVSAGGIGSFVLADVVVPWAFTNTFFCLAALSSYSMQRYREARRKLQLEMEMQTAAALQKNYFPEPDAATDDYEIATYYHPADAVGGDWYTYYVYNKDWLYIHLGDVTGHGTSAALLASYANGATDMIRHEFTTAGEASIPLERIHTSLNNILSEADDFSALMTMISVVINLRSGECRFLNSGHRPAMLVENKNDETNAVTLTSKTPYILGFRQFPRALVPGMRSLVSGNFLLLYSDGLIDVPQSRGIRCNEKILKKILLANASLDACNLRDRIAETLQIAGTNKNDSFIDDVTFIVVRLRFTALAAKEVDVSA